MYFLYILKSKRALRTYIGCTADVRIRLLQHNGGHVRSTKAYRPWELVYLEPYRSKTEARKRGIRLKRHSATKEELYQKLGLRHTISE